MGTSLKYQLMGAAHKIGIDPYDVRVLGPKAWKQIHGACLTLQSDCECRQECVDLTMAMHDLINMKLGKPVRNWSNFRRVANRYNKAANSSGSCPGGRC